MPVIPATQEAKVGGSCSEASRSKKQETPSKKHTKAKSAGSGKALL
jgi:hypothetical protein